VPVALIIPKGFGEHPISFGPAQPGTAVQMLNDASDPIAPQVVSGLLQKVAMTSMPESMAKMGMDYTGQFIGGFTPAQKQRVEDELTQLQDELKERSGAQNSSAADGFAGIFQVDRRAVGGHNNNGNMISFYAAAIGVMFLLFTASGAAGSLLDEAESGALDRVLSSRITMGTLLGGKLLFNTLLAFMQLVVMFLWGWAVFKLDFFSHIPGFIVMGVCSAWSWQHSVSCSHRCATRALSSELYPPSSS
jgi:ABC-2 type transport system permease protein